MYFADNECAKQALYRQLQTIAASDTESASETVPQPFDNPNYDELARVLVAAYNQAAYGKGAVRHAVGNPFEEQVICEGARRFGVGSMLFQAFKKSEESQRLPHDHAVSELLGAIVYLSAAVLILEETHAKTGVTEGVD